MKIAKKSLSLILSLLMVFSACSVCLVGMGISAAAATGTAQSVKNALTDEIALEIVTNGNVYNDMYVYKGDPAVIAVAEEVYAYAVSLIPKNASANTSNNTMEKILQLVANNTGFTSGNKYTALMYLINPPGSEITSFEDGELKKDGDTHEELKDGFIGIGKVDHKYDYPSEPLPYQSIVKTVKIYTSVNALLEKYGSVEAIPASMLQGVEYKYAHGGDQACIDVPEKNGCNKTVYRCWGHKFNFVSSVHRKEVKNIVSVDELKNFKESLASKDLTMTFDQMIALPAADLEAIYNENYAPYQAMIDKYTSDTVRKFFGDYNDYFDALLKAMQINLAKPAIDILLENVGKTYDSTDLDEMLAIYTPTNTAYNVVKDFSSDVFDYVKADPEYAAFDLAATKTYVDDLAYAIEVFQLPELKALIEGDIAEYEGKDLNIVAVPVLESLLDKLNAHKETLETKNTTAVNALMGSTVVKLDNLIAAVEANLEARAPEDTYETFKVEYDYFEVYLLGDYTGKTNDQLVSMYNDYEDKVKALEETYADLVETYGKDVIDSLFKVTIGENGTPALLQTAVKSIGTTQLKNEIIARNSAQIAILAGYKDMAATVTFDNLVTIGSAVKDFNQKLYKLCADNGWVSDADAKLYSDVSTVINNYNAFIANLETKGFTKVELDKNGVYTEREVYDEDLVKDATYKVTTDKMDATIVKLDNFLASEAFGELVGLKDSDGNSVGLGDYVYDMLGNLLFKDDLVNMIIGMLFPMIEDLLVTELGNLLGGESLNPNKTPGKDPGALGYVDVSALVDAISGGIDVYIGDVTKLNQEKIQMSYAELLKSAGLYIFPSTLADSMVSSGVLTTSSDTYKYLKEAGDSWQPLGVFDEQTETYTYDLKLEWGITDRASFFKVLGGVLDSIGSLLPTVFLNQAFEKTLGDNNKPAGVGYGSMSAISIVNINNAEFYAALPLVVQPLNLYSKLIQPLFNLLGLDASASLSTSSKGIDYAKAVFNPIFELLDKIVANPLDTILGILPSVSYILSTNFIDTFLAGVVLDFSVSLKIVGSNGDGIATLLDNFGDLLKFEVFADQMGIADIAGSATLKELVGIDISNINKLLDYVLESLNVKLDLPELDQTALIECAKWNSKTSLTADKADVLFFLLKYIVGAISPEFFGAILGDDANATVKAVLNKISNTVKHDPDDALAAIVELLNPTTYSFKQLNAPVVVDESLVYLHYANDWTKSESQYIIDNAMDIVGAVLKMTGKESSDVNALLKSEYDNAIAGAFTNDAITNIVKGLAGIKELPAILQTILVDELGIDMSVWSHDFGYLFDETKTAPESAILNVTVEEVDGKLVWNGMADGDRAAFITAFCDVLAPFAPAVAFLFGGEDLSAFGLLELKGYASFDKSIGLLLDALGVEISDVDFSTDPMGALATAINDAFDWLDAALVADNFGELAVNAVAGLLSALERNGLSVFVHNLLMPVLSLVDTVRPVFNVDVNTILSAIVSDAITGKGIDGNKILDLLLGTYEGELDLAVNVNVDNLTLSEIFKIVDVHVGSDLSHSALVTIGLKGICNPDLDAADALTIILSAIIDCFDDPVADTGKTNAQAIFGFIAEKTGNNDIGNIVESVLRVIGGVVYEYSQPDWDYMFGGTDLEFNSVLPEHTIVYLGYKNNWTKETADAVYDTLDEVLELVLAAVLEEGQSLSTLIDGLLNGKVYTDANLNAIVELIVNALAKLDATLFETIDVVVDTDISTWFTFCTYDDAKAKYICTEKWGVDAAADADKKDVFVAGLKAVLAPAERLLAWLFFEDSYEFFTDSEKDENGNYTYNGLIVLNGGRGYEKGLVPILEAIGLTMQPAANFYDEATESYDVGEAVAGIVDSLLNFVDEVLDAPIEEVLALVPNVIYFINANGIKSSVNNILAPVNGIIAELSAMVGDISIGGLLDDSIGFDITDITMDTLLKILDDNGVKMSEKHKALLKEFYIGELSQFKSANGDYAYRLAYNDKESAGDMLTIVLSFALDLLVLNEELFAPILGEENYAAIIDVLEITEEKARQEFSWMYMEFADTDKVFNATNTSIRYENPYNTIWTRDKAEYIADNLVPFVTNILGLVGLEINGVAIKDLDDLLDSLLEGNLYTQATIDSIMEILSDLPALFGDYSDIGKQAIKIVDAAIGTKIASWETMEVVVEDGNRDSFVAALKQILTPIIPLLDVLLCGEDLSFFYNIEGNDVITIPGSEGYAYGFVPLFEALGCEMMTPDEFKALDDADKAGALIESLLARVDVILADPVNEIFAMLPEVIYFINSNGLDTSVKNILNGIDTVLQALEPITGKTDLMAILGVDLTVYNFDYIVNMACKAIKDSTGLDVEPLILDFAAELTMGKVYSYQSANGETYYKMAYAGENQFADMITVLIRLAVDWLATGDNADAVIALIENNAESEEAANSGATLVKLVLKGLNTEPTLSGSMAVLYYVFYGLNNAADGLDTLYGNYGESWDALVDMFESSEDVNVEQVGGFLSSILKEFGGVDVDSSKDGCDCNCHSNSSFIRFFFKFANFFRRLFGMNEFKTCACGDAHW